MATCFCCVWTTVFGWMCLDGCVWIVVFGRLCLDACACMAGCMAGWALPGELSPPHDHGEPWEVQPKHHADTKLINNPSMQA
jgi:hypothetical protein